MSRIAILPNLIIDVLRKSHLLSAKKITQKLSNSGKTFNKTSVYRTLDKLLTDGLICKESFTESEAMYELRKNHHDHAVCTNCEKIISVDCHDEKHQHQKILGFLPDHHHTTIFGLCDSCTKKI